MLKRNIGLQFNGRDFDDGNEWQHHVDCLEGGDPAGAETSLLGQWREATSFFPFRRALADFLRNAATPTNMQEPGHFTPHPPQLLALACTRQTKRRPTHVSLVDHVSVLVVRRNFTHI
jgi:hypothetical protein